MEGARGLGQGQGWRSERDAHIESASGGVRGGHGLFMAGFVASCAGQVGATAQPKSAADPCIQTHHPINSDPMLADPPSALSPPSPVRPVAALNESCRATGDSEPPLAYPPP